MSEHRGQADLTLLLDVGDFSGTSDVVGTATSYCLLEGLRLMGYDAVTLGERDLAHGPAFVEEAALRLGAPFLTANVVDSTSGTPAGDPLRLRRAGGISIGRWRVGGVRLALVGVTREGDFPVPADSSGRVLVVRPPEEELGRRLPAIRAQADVVIVLAHLGKGRAEAFAEGADGVDVVISGHGVGAEPEPRRVGKTYFVHANERGTAVGDLTLVVARGRGVVEARGTEDLLTTDLPEDPRITALIDHCPMRVKARQAGALTTPAIAREESARATGGRAVPPAAAPAGAAGTPGPSSYVGAGACRECHEAVFVRWSRTAHAHAFSTLEARGKGDDPACTRCHTTGYGRGNGFRTLDFTPKMTNVQCEECHGAGSTHIALMERARAEGTPQVVAPGTLIRGASFVCLRCHNRNQDPDFNFEREKVRGSHP